MMRKRYAVCGVSNRALKMFVKPMLSLFQEHTEVVGLLDPDPRRFEVAGEQYPSLKELPCYKPEELEKMIRECRPDVLLIAGRDNTHARYVLAALEHDIDSLVEKPMAAGAEDCQKIIDAEKKSKGRVQVTFNYRYTAIHRRIKEMILQGKVGRITSIDLNWYIDTYHGSSYFRRWNRYREISGGLSIHKASHHFDLVNWWTGQRPEEVFAFGALNYYGPEGPKNPSIKDGRFCQTCDEKDQCIYYRRWNHRTGDAEVKDDHLDLDEARKANFTGYRTDACIFDSDIQIEDTYTATIRYDKGAMLSYSVNFSTPWEGYRVAINGTEGRIESTEYHMPQRIPFPFEEHQTIEYYPLFGSKEIIHVVERPGGHHGADPVLLEDVFLGPDPSRDYEIASSSLDGALAVATGEAVWKSVRDRRPYKLRELLTY
ncbi:oxidoreductase [Marispirochaeta aestuarii]|uniref:Oxidoreductase n=2 Tax=Marispirochaeta aestuarii TaxID=1963862 RepID=A0A1Y1RZ46_9SPIO|nr:oxidoreductase [Marispirochaeta aestuarii]